MIDIFFKTIRDHEFKYLDGEQITISLGVSSFKGKSIQSPDQLVKLADEAMYKAKSLGKNCVMQA